MYDYQEEKSKLLTTFNHREFMEIRDRAFKLINEAGAAKMGNIILNSKMLSSLTMFASVDFLVEMEVLKEIKYGDCVIRDRIFIQGI